MNNFVQWFVRIGILLFFIFPQITLAQSNKATMKDSEVVARLEYIQKRLDQGTFSAKSWQYGWLGFYSAVVVADTATYFKTDDSDKKYDSAVDFILTGSAILDMSFNPLKAISAAEKLRQSQDRTSEERLRELKEAEFLLQMIAQKEKERRSIKKYLIGGLFATIGGVAIGVGDQRPSDGFRYFGIVLLSSALNTYTTPTQGISDWNQYQRTFDTGVSTSFSNTRETKVFYAYPLPDGIGFTWLF
ncbi:MAG: hypothetical protein ACI86H_003013 [bacterium]|jgi:hypothetical protein